MRKVLLIVIIFTSWCTFAQDVFTPEKILGYSIGKQFTRHDQVIHYFNELSKSYPNQVKKVSYGHTYENRELFICILASEANLKRIETIRQNHMNNAPQEDVALVWLSYNVHGNESSGTEAAMQTAYDLLTKNKNLLENTVVIMDPCLNPDGRDRYVNFYYQYGNQPFESNRISAEHNEPWPGGRPNHYLFDLNRDWAWLTQIESQTRIPLYNSWLPHVHVDFHEQGINEPYYFPPAAEPYHEVITDWQRAFQKDIGKNHAKYFDKASWLYFSKEIFDLLYPSYGDTYPTYNGSIGMTYEQGGSGRAGLSVITQVGDTLSLLDRVTHHVTTGISTVEVSSEKSKKLISEYQAFCKNKNYKYKSYILDGNAPNIGSLLSLLDQHEIKYSFGIENSAVKGFDFDQRVAINYKLKANDIVVSTKQLKGTLVNVLFEPVTKLSDSLTYDITAWSLPYAYGVNAIASEQELLGKLGSLSSSDQLDKAPPTSCFAYILPWNSMTHARCLTALQKENFNVYFNEQDFEIEGKKFKQGCLIILRGENKRNDFDEKVNSIAQQYGVTLESVASGFVDKGLDLGSSSVKKIAKQNIGLLIGENASSLSVGEVWHYFEQDLHHAVQLIFEADLSDALNSLDVLFVPEGSFDFSSKEYLGTWIENGGKLIVMGSSVNSFTSLEGYGIKYKENATDTISDSKEINYALSEREEISNTLIGAIYSCELDNSHPLCFGYSEQYFTLKLNADVYELKSEDVIKVNNKNAHVTGFVGANVRSKQEGSLTVGVHSYGQGSVIYFIDNPLFRGFWENGKLQIANAIFFVNQN